MILEIILFGQDSILEIIHLGFYPFEGKKHCGKIQVGKYIIAVQRVHLQCSEGMVSSLNIEFNNLNCTSILPSAARLQVIAT